MMEQAPNTLFDRLVMRAITPAQGLAAPFDPVFERSGEEVIEPVAPTFGVPPSEPEAPLEDGGHRALLESPPASVLTAVRRESEPTAPSRPCGAIREFHITDRNFVQRR